MEKSHSERDFIILLDKSSSMSDCREAAVAHFNDMVTDIQAQCADFKGEVFVSLVTFESEVHFKFWRQPLAKLRKIEYSEFVPTGCTALHDAIGMSIVRMRELKSPILLSVITDGEENSSIEFKNKIAPMIRQCQSKGNWTFLYLGADHDVVTTAASMGFNPGNTAIFTNTNAGVTNATAYTASCMRSYVENLDNGGSATRGFYGHTATAIDLRDEGNAGSPFSNNFTLRMKDPVEMASSVSINGNDVLTMNAVTLDSTDTSNVAPSKQRKYHRSCQ